MKTITPPEDSKIKLMLSDPNVPISRLVQYPPTTQSAADHLEALLKLLRARSPIDIADAAQYLCTVVIHYHYNSGEAAPATVEPSLSAEQSQQAPSAVASTDGDAMECSVTDT